MADILCPICNRINDPSAERCWYCQARLSGVQNSHGNEENSQAENPPVMEDHDQSLPAGENKDEDVPDWLARIRELEREDQSEQEEVSPLGEGKKKNTLHTDWLNDLRSDADAQDIIAPENEFSLVQEDVTENADLQDLVEKTLPDDKDETGDAFDAFLAELGIGSGKTKHTTTSPEVEETSHPTEKYEKEDISSRFAFEEASSQEILPESIAEKEESASEEPPDEEVAQSRTQEVAPPFPWEPQKDIEEIEEKPVLEPDVQIAEEEQDESKVDPLPTLPPISGEFGSIPPMDLPPGEISFDNDDLPEWLSSEQPEVEKKAEKPAVKNPETPPVAAGKLERAQLPAWLHAIRPVESMVPLEPETMPRVEEEKGVGVLSGIEGVLHSSNIASQITRPQVYASGIQANEQQLKNAALFTSLIQMSADEIPVEAPIKLQAKTSSILRLLITILILAMVVLPFFFSIPFIVTPALFPSEVVNTFGQIQALPAGKPILLAANFEAGLAGEINWSSRAVFEHLLSRNTPLAIVSTNSIGSAVVNEHVQEIALSQPGYMASNQILNLGYLPGGTLGILALSKDLQQTLPFTADLQPAWIKPGFQSIYRLSDFGAVLILTDNADNVKSWVEQVGASSDAPPILAVVSAQASPMTQPYYDSGQIKGFVAGMNGSRSYEQIMQRPSSATAEFSSFQITLLVIAIIIFLGGAVTLILPSAPGTKKEGGK